MEVLSVVAAIIAVCLFVVVPVPMLWDRTDNGYYALGWAVFSILIVAGLVGYMVDHTPPAEHFTLATANWECTSTYQVRRFTGKVWVTSTECAAYTRKEQ